MGAHWVHHGCAQGRGTERGYCAALGTRGVGCRSARAERQAGLPGAYLRDCWLLATICFFANARAPCAWVSLLMSSFCSCIILHMSSQAEAEILWHVRSTCHVWSIRFSGGLYAALARSSPSLTMVKTWPC